jgi:hypothetical protein
LIESTRSCLCLSSFYREICLAICQWTCEADAWNFCS